MGIECVHIRDAKAGDYYCGRKSSFYKAPIGVHDLSILGNPFGKGKLWDYRIYLKNKINNDPLIHSVMVRLSKENVLGHIRLVCFCKPKDCHTDIIKEFLEEDGEAYANRD